MKRNYSFNKKRFDDYSIYYFKTRIPQRTGKTYLYTYEMKLHNFIVSWVCIYHSQFNPNSIRLRFNEIYEDDLFLQTKIRINNGLKERKTIDIDTEPFPYKSEDNYHKALKTRMNN
jgi:hypothetical protein